MSREELQKVIEELLIRTVGVGSHKDWFIELEDGIYDLIEREKAQARAEGMEIVRNAPRHKHIPCEWNDCLDHLITQYQDGEKSHE
jgi:hypothetical protein